MGRDLDGVVDHFTLPCDEAGWLRNKSGATGLGFAVQLKFCSGDLGGGSRVTWHLIRRSLTAPQPTSPLVQGPSRRRALSHARSGQRTERNPIHNFCSATHSLGRALSGGRARQGSASIASIGGGSATPPHVRGVLPARALSGAERMLHFSRCFPAPVGCGQAGRASRCGLRRVLGEEDGFLAALLFETVADVGGETVAVGEGGVQRDKAAGQGDAVGEGEGGVETGQGLAERNPLASTSMATSGPRRPGRCVLPADDVAEGRDTEIDDLPAADLFGIELGEFVPASGEADFESFDLAQPAFMSGFGDPCDEVVADLGQARALGGVGAKHGAADAPLTERTTLIVQFRAQVRLSPSTVCGRDGRSCARARSVEVGRSSVGSAGGDRRPVRALPAR